MSSSSYSYREFESDSERLYAHLLNLRTLITPADLVERFRVLFQDSLDYPDPSIVATLQRIVGSKWADFEFGSVLNRCCYILINYWLLQGHSLLQPEFNRATVDLINVLTNCIEDAAHSSTGQRLQELIRQFLHTPQYDVLQRRARAVDRPEDHDPKTERVGDLIYRYPYLYPYCLLDWDSSDMGNRAVKQLQGDREREFERDLFRYTNMVRRSRSSQKQTGVVETANPTLLSTDEVERAIKQFAGKVEGTRTYRDSAQYFLQELRQVKSHREVKHRMYEYLITSIHYSSQPDYGRHRFNGWLSEQLTHMQPQSDGLRPNSSLLVQTCGQLIDALVANPKHMDNHLMFIDVIGNLGATFTVGLLLKIVLIFRNTPSNLESIRSYLAKRFAVMFKHYESKIQQDIQWLIACLDNLLVAFTVHFGHQKDSSVWLNLVS